MQSTNELKENRYFADLDIDIIKDKADDWSTDFPCIEKIELCRAGSELEEINVKYVIAVTVPPRPYKFFKNNNKSWFSLKYKDIDIEDSKESFEEKLESAISIYPDLENLIDYHEWSSPGNVENIRNDIPSFYKDQSDDRNITCTDEWFWFEIEPGKNAIDYNIESSDFVKMQDRARIELYSGKKSLPQTQETEKKLTLEQKDKMAIQKEGKLIWSKEPCLQIKHVVMHPNISKIAGKLYRPKTIRIWLKEIAPEHAHRKGIRPPEERKKQIRACKRLGIPIK